ncbi:claudin-10-like [Acipenser ruthenus]|uniref:claudin-10-like n=1 Tax=Acipenser ruthenus TaxID=7906 RepID=UPI002741D163|nr:claudin-10-like [Acipenser ruthenus]
MNSVNLEIIALVVEFCGWVLVCCTLPIDYWKWSSLDGNIITTAVLWSNLWKSCFTDSAGVTECRDLSSILGQERYIQACRGLMIGCVALGVFGAMFALFGMRCTRIGGTDTTKSKIACVAGGCYIVGGLCSLSAYSLYANRITAIFDPTYTDQKYELGSPLFIGWSGSVLCFVGGSIFCLINGKDSKPKRNIYSYTGGSSYITANPKTQRSMLEYRSRSKDPKTQRSMREYRSQSKDPKTQRSMREYRSQSKDPKTQRSMREYRSQSKDPKTQRSMLEYRSQSKDPKTQRSMLEYRSQSKDFDRDAYV